MSSSDGQEGENGNSSESTSDGEHPPEPVRIDPAETDSDTGKCELKFLTLAFLSNYLVISNVNVMAD